MITTEAVKRCHAARQQLVRERLQGVLEEASRAGLAAEEICAMVERELRRVSG